MLYFLVLSAQITKLNLITFFTPTAIQQLEQPRPMAAMVFVAAVAEEQCVRERQRKSELKYFIKYTTSKIKPFIYSGDPNTGQPITGNIQIANFANWNMDY